jgi:hypothetical protein
VGVAAGARGGNRVRSSSLAIHAEPGPFGLGQQRLGVGDERAVRGRPRHPVDGGVLGHRAGRIPDRRADLGAQPPGSPRPGRDLLDGLGEGTAFAVVLPARPAGLVPPHYDSILTVGNVARRSAHLTLHRRGEHSARRAPRRRLTRGSPHHTSPIGPALDNVRPVLLTAQPTMSYRRARPWFRFPKSESCEAFRRWKAKGLQLQRHAL